jgi:hypothetical protein
LTCWSDKWLPGLIFLVAGLFADKNNATSSTFTKDRLSRVQKQGTSLTFCCFLAKFSQIADAGARVNSPRPASFPRFSSFLIRDKSRPHRSRAGKTLDPENLSSMGEVNSFRSSMYLISIMALVLVISIGSLVPKAAAQSVRYSKMAPVDQYLMEVNAEILLARSAAPDSISSDATDPGLGTARL